MIPYLQIGTGRLGSAITRAIESESKLAGLLTSAARANSRLDPKNGLCLVGVSAQTVKIDKLLICIAPGIDKKWRWNEIFNGLAQQVLQQQLTINELIFISSTRVYDGILNGIVTAKSPVKAQTDRAKGLVFAEKQLVQLANSHCLLRCCGLIGEPYQRFQEILKQPDDKVRFAVDIEQVAKKVVERLINKPTANQFSIVTDGGCYYRGRRMTFEEAAFLSSGHRLLKQSDYYKK